MELGPQRHEAEHPILGVHAQFQDVTAQVLHHEAIRNKRDIFRRPQGVADAVHRGCRPQAVEATVGDVQVPGSAKSIAPRRTCGGTDDRRQRQDVAGQDQPAQRVDAAYLQTVGKYAWTVDENDIGQAQDALGPGADDRDAGAQGARSRSEVGRLQPDDCGARVEQEQRLEGAQG
jgi:hypothetical protein